MDLEKLKQLDNQNEQKRKKDEEDKMSIPIKKWESQLNSEKFEEELQKEFEEELNDGERLELTFVNSHDDATIKAYRKCVALYGRYTGDIYKAIIAVVFNSEASYSSSELNKLLTTMYNMLKNKLEELGFIITKEDGEVKAAQYDNYEKVKIYLKVK